MNLTNEDVKRIASETAQVVLNESLPRVAQAAADLAVRNCVDKDEMHSYVSEAVRQTFIQLGIGSNDPLEMQKDMQHLRDWRKSMETIREKTLLTIIAVAVTGVLAALWLGFKALVLQK